MNNDMNLTNILPSADRKTILLESCASITLRKCLDFKGGRRLTILVDRGNTAKLPWILFGMAQELGGKVNMLVVPKTDAIKDDSAITNFLRRSEILIACTSEPFPIDIREQILHEGGRVVLMHTVTDETAIRTIPINYEELRILLDQAAEGLHGSADLTMTSPRGTDVRFSCKGRPLFNFDGICRNNGEYDSLPAGSIYSSPVESAAEGTIVVDTTGYDTGLIRNPIKLTLKRGFVTNVSGDGEAKRLKQLIEKGGENAGNFAEVGIGLNSKARLGCYPIENERAAGSVTIGLGRNTQMGGTVNSKVHLDIGVLSQVTLRADGRSLIERGRLMIKCLSEPFGV